MSKLVTPDLRPLVNDAPNQASGPNASGEGPSGGSQCIVDVTPDNINELAANSKAVPLLLYFSAEWCEPCKTLRPILEKVANNYNGAFVLAKVDADEHAIIARQLGVRGLPTLKLIKDGQLVGELTGVQTEETIQALLDKHVTQADNSDEDPLIQQVERARRMGAHAEALEALQQAIEKNPKHTIYQKLLVFILIDQGEFDGAQKAIEYMPKEDANRTAAAARLEFAKIALDLLPQNEAEVQLIRVETEYRALRAEAEQVENLDERKAELAELIYTLGVRKVMGEDYSSALDHFLRLFADFPSFRDGLGKKSLLDTFDLLGRKASLSKQYQRKMFALLH